MKNSKFIPLYETIYDRYKQGSGFLQGDVVKLKKDYKSADSYKALPEMIKQRLEDAEKSGYNLRIGRLHTPNNSAGSLGINTSMPATHLDLFQEPSPGSYGNLVTIPIDLVEYIDTGVNLPEVSSKNKRPNKDYIKPGKWKANKDEPETKEQNHLGHEQNWIKKGDYELATKNKKPSVGGNSYDDEKPSKFKPLKGTKKLTKESVGLEGLYIQMLTEDVTNDVDPQGYSVPEKTSMIEERMVKPECWNKESSCVMPECMNEDGSVKDECWAPNSSGSIPAAPVVRDPETMEQTSAESKTKLTDEAYVKRTMMLDDFMQEFESDVESLKKYYMNHRDQKEEEALLNAIELIASAYDINIVDL